MDPHLLDLRYFLAVAEELSVTRAAERVFVSQPALSKRIRRLERDLGVALLSRGHRAIALTAAGEALRPRARAMVEAWDAALVEVRAAAGEEAGEVAVGLHTAVGRGLYARAAPALADRHPGVRVTLRAVGWEDPTAGLADGSSDVALVWLPLPDDPRIATRVLLSEPRLVAMPAGNPLADAADLTMDDLLDEPFVALPPEAGPLRDFWLATAERGGREPVVAAVATGADETFEMIDAGVGVALVSAGNAGLYRREGVVACPVAGLAPCELAVAWRRDERRRAVLDMVDCLMEAAVLPDE